MDWNFPRQLACCFPSKRDRREEYATFLGEGAPRADLGKVVATAFFGCDGVYVKRVGIIVQGACDLADASIEVRQKVMQTCHLFIMYPDYCLGRLCSAATSVDLPAASSPSDFFGGIATFTPVVDGAALGRTTKRTGAHYIAI